MSYMFSSGRRCMLAIAATVLFISTALANGDQQSRAGLYDLDEAISQGVVDINFNPWTKRPIKPVLEHLSELNPGLINRVGFLYGGPSSFFLNAAGDLVAAIRNV